MSCAVLSTAMLPLEATVIHPRTRELGFLHQILVAPDAIYAIGGTYHKPTLLVSSDRGRSFELWKTPPSSGLRGMRVVDGAVWIIGEYGLFAYTRDRGATWTKVKLPKTSGTTCMYCVDRDAAGRIWVTGDDGMILRSKARTGKSYDVMPTKTTGRMLCLWLDSRDGLPWLLDTTGTVQRFNGKAFVVVDIRGRTKQPLCQIKRTAAGTLIVVGDGGVVLRSETDGATWKRITAPTKLGIPQFALTRFGIILVAFDGLVVSHDDGRTLARVETTMVGKLWSIADAGDAVLVGGEEGVIYRISNAELARLLHAVYADRDATLAALAATVRDGVDGADLVLEDALRERGLY